MKNVFFISLKLLEAVDMFEKTAEFSIIGKQLIIEPPLS